MTQPYPLLLEERVLVSMPNPRDAERAVALLTDAGMSCVACADLASLCASVREGAGAVLLADEILLADGERQLEVALRAQPAWSALPLVVLAPERAAERAPYAVSDAFKNVIIVERPVRTLSLLSVVRSALRARRHQYDIRDAISERDRRARELLAQDEKLRFALSAGKLGSWELDFEKEELICSDICKANFGRPLDEPFTYAQFRACVHPDDAARVFAAIAHSAASGAPYDVEYRVSWPNGELHWVMARGRAVYDAWMRPTKMIGVTLDVTERERLHDALRQSQVELAKQADQLRTADRLKDEFLATLAHELRNPLAPVMTGLELLRRPADPRQSRQTLDVMQRQVSYMVRLIDDLLDVSRITSGKLELKRARVSLASVIDAAVEGSMPNIQRGRHTLRTDLTDEPLWLDADHVRVAQVVGNLLNNSTKYTAEGGLIELSARREGDFVAIAVRDNGAGIPKDRIEDVFRMFSQLDRSEGGLGIGLALVRTLVELHGGTVTAESAGPGQGSTFTVRLPLAVHAPAPAVEHSEHPRLLGRSGAGRVLVVDDNDDAAQLLALMLEQSGYETTVAGDGHAAIEAVLKTAPHFVILDIGLPDMSGYEVAEQLRSTFAAPAPALIALTGWGTPEDRRKALDAGFDVHLTKPVTPSDLHDAMSRAAARRQSQARAS